MPVSKTPLPGEHAPEPRQTSITAHTVLTVVVSMTTLEMDTIAGMLRGIDQYSVTDAQAMVRDGFIDALESVR